MAGSHDTPECSSDGDDTASETRLLELPAELRNRIYELVLDHHSETRHCLCTLPTPRHKNTPPVEKRYNRPGLIDTCRQIDQEAGKMWFSKLKVHAYDSYGLREWLQAIGQKKASFLTSVAVARGGICISASSIESQMRFLRKDIVHHGFHVADEVVQAKWSHDGQKVASSSPREEYTGQR